MQTDWLIDFMTLAQTRSFSRAAQLRHVTQPAFSRRIQSLETWAMVTLVNRSCHPPALTPAGELLCAKAPELVEAVQHTRAMLRTHTPGHQDVLEFVVLPALASHFFPLWLTRLQDTWGAFSTRLSALGMADGLARLAEGGCDLLLIYQCADQPPDADLSRYDRQRLASEQLIPYARPDAFGRPMHSLPGSTDQPLPYLAYAPSAWFGQVVEQSLMKRRPSPHLVRHFESDSAESLKAMALAGHGVAFLPESVARDAVASGGLVPAGDPLDTVLDICLLRNRPTHPLSSKGALNFFWSRLGGARAATFGPKATSPDHRVQDVLAETA